MSLSARSASVVLCLILVAHAVVSIAQSRTLRPWSDEGAMASPAHDLITRGSMEPPRERTIFPKHSHPHVLRHAGLLCRSRRHLSASWE